MKDTWVLTVRTSLPKACENAYGLKLDVYAFESFQEGRDAARKVMNGFAFAKNKMFDGKGKLIRMTWCSKSMVSEKEEECSSDYFSRERMEYIQELLRKIFQGEDVVPGLKSGKFTNYCDIAYSYKKGVLKMYGDEEGVDNGYDPVLETNMFSMQKEQDYYLHIVDAFGQDDPSAELFIDLQKAKPFEDQRKNG